MKNRVEIDRFLSDAAEAREVAGVVALATTRSGMIYEGAFGRRGLPDGARMSLDSVFWIASMTKAITATAAMQLVEQGRLGLEQSIREVLPELAAPQVLEGFDAAGAPRLRPAKKAMTLRHLLTHTSGFGYDTWNPLLFRYAAEMGVPRASSGKLAGLRMPLAFEPGQRWEYGIGIDWLGRVVEAVSGESLDVYMRKHIIAPLDMRDTGYILRPDQKRRQAQMHRRGADGTLEPFEREVPQHWEYFPGGGGLNSTGRDYLNFLRMLLNEGRFDGVSVLKAETVALMGKNHIGRLNVTPLKSFNPLLSNDIEIFPGMPKKWGLSFLINTRKTPTGRSAGSLAWAGLGNTFFWLDPKRRVAGLLMTQTLPFGDRVAMKLFDAFETSIYQSLA